jgi:hypothetical protein
MAKKKAAAKKVAAKKAKKKAAKKPAAKKAAKPEPESLGRPKVAAEEELYHVFHQHYDARQVFEFLRVQTVRELEQFTPQEIFRRLTQPMRNTVDLIRRVLAEKNRHLAGDLEFALQCKHEEESGE